jgi:HSP20 family protein
MLVRFDFPRTLDNLINDVFESDVTPCISTFPAIDIAEHDNETVVVAELPGAKKEDVKVKFEDNVLTISGERKPYEIPENARILLNEMRVKEFSRSVEFEHDVDAGKISAEMTNGILTVRLPKAESARARTIEVK